MPTAVVTGCDSGIGHAFAQVLCNEGYSVIATDRNVGDNLKRLKNAHGASIARLDVSSPVSIQDFKKTIAEQPVDLLLNIAGVADHPEKDALNTVSLPILERTFSVNTFGPLLLTQALLPSLLKSPQPRVGIMSSRVGSMADNSSGGSYAYRASKAAVNSIGKSMAVDLKGEGVVVILMHPGIVKTGILPGIHAAPEAVEPQEAATKLWKVLMNKGIEDTGTFWHREGMELPW